MFYENISKKENRFNLPISVDLSNLPAPLKIGLAGILFSLSTECPFFGVAFYFTCGTVKLLSTNATPNGNKENI